MTNRTFAVIIATWAFALFVGIAAVAIASTPLTPQARVERFEAACIKDVEAGRLGHTTVSQCVMIKTMEYVLHLHGQSKDQEALTDAYKAWANLKILKIHRINCLQLDPDWRNCDRFR